MLKRVCLLVAVLAFKQSVLAAVSLANITTNWKTEHVKIELDVPILFYGNYYSVIYVSTNGVINIGQSYSRTSWKFYKTRVLVPYHVEVYLKRTLTVHLNNDTNMLDAFSKRINANFRLEKHFNVKDLLSMTWKIFMTASDVAMQTVTLEMGSNNKDTFFTISYQKNESGFYQTFLNFIYGNILTGFSAGDSVRAFQMFGGKNGDREHYDEILSKRSNINEPGVWAFGFGRNQNFSVRHPDVQDSTTNVGYCDRLRYRCHAKAICSEQKQRCECKPGFIGNGINCLLKGDFILLTGNINGKVDVHQLFNLRSYVFVNQSSGIITVTISPVENYYSPLFRSLVSVFGLFSWMFARTAKNTFLGPDLHGDRLQATTVIQFNKDPDKTIIIEQTVNGYAAGRIQTSTVISGNSTIDFENFQERLQYIRNTSESFHHVADGEVTGKTSLKISPHDQVDVTRVIRFEPLGIDISPKYQIETSVEEVKYSAVTQLFSVTFSSRLIKHGGTEQVVLVQSGSLKQFSIPYDEKSFTYLHEDYGHNLIGVDYDCKSGFVFFTDATDGTIKRVHPSNTTEVQAVVERLSFPEGVAVDWIHSKIYWTDSTTKTIGMSSVLGSQQKVLIDTNINNPRSIVVHPRLRKVFWSDWERKNPRIEETDLDGRSRSTFAGSEFLTAPNGLTINFETNELCWTDAGVLRLACAKLNANNFQVRVLVENVGHPFALSISENRILWTDWNNDKVNQLSRLTKKRLDGIVPGFSNDGVLYDIKRMDACPF